MNHNKLLASHYHIFIPMLILFFLTAGILITVSETQQIEEISSQASATNCTIPATGFTTKTAEQTLLIDINSYRQQNKINPLTLDSTLKQSSEWLSLDMAAHTTLSHVDSLNRAPDIRLSNCGYSVNNGYGENIAEGSKDPTVVFNAWKNDPPHSQILLDPRYTITGISVETSANGTAFWTMDLGVGPANFNPSVTSSPNVPTPTVIPVPSSAGTTTTPGTPDATISPTSSTTVSPDISPSVSPSPSLNPDFPTPTTGPLTADMQIAVSVKIFGIGQDGNPNPKHRTRKIVASVYDVSNQLVTTGTGFLNYDGSNYFTGVIHLGKMSEGAYFVKLVGDNTLQVLAKPEFQNLKVNQVNTIPTVTLYQGDMNNDNILDINDYNAVLPCFQSIPVCADTSQIDFNDDGVVDVRDYNLFLNSFEMLHGD
jgi:uncharacterized protein YkwD